MDEINKLKQQANLHSSMDRFEDLSAIYIVRKTSIYIPVWIDLKLSCGMWKQLSRGNLHSSMDRFEVQQLQGLKLKSGIYIPVWIDLKFQRKN